MNSSPSSCYSDVSADDALSYFHAAESQSYSSDKVSNKTRYLRRISSSHEVPNVPSLAPHHKLQPVSSYRSPLKSESSLSKTINKERSQRKILSSKHQHTSVYAILPPITEHVKEEHSDESVHSKDSELNGGPLFNYSYKRSEVLQTIDDEIISLQKRVTLAEVAVRDSTLLRDYGFKPQESSSLKNGENMNTKQASRDRSSWSFSSTQSMMYSPRRREGPSRNLQAKSKDSMDLEGKYIGSPKSARTEVGRLVQGGLNLGTKATSAIS